ncbi:MAG TPA: hypothetical protein [Caudoviricetes sp.]|nr:MAG TPA: hypothetical protein [Caudoviricetes sp.]
MINCAKRQKPKNLTHLIHLWLDPRVYLIQNVLELYM